MAEVAVIGAGSSGLAVLRALHRHGVAVGCFERGSGVGGLWRYQNDDGRSSAYASLRTNVSRKRMEYPGFPMPGSYGDFPGHRDMAAYLDAYADAFGLRELIGFGVTVERLEPDLDGSWRVALDDGSVRRFRAVVVATGHDWCPRLPEEPDGFAGEVSHSHDYRTPEGFAGRGVLVVGAGQSAADLLYGRRVARELGPLPAGWPLPARRLLEGIPVVSTDLLPAVRRGEVTVKPAVERLAGDRVGFADGTEEAVDRIVYATGYRISLPFLSPLLVAPRGRELPLYRRIVPPGLGGLLFAGFVDAPGGLLPVVETQAEWIAAVLTGRLRLPAPEGMWRAIDRGERRSRQRFPDERPQSIRCDPHAYRRLLRSDLRRAPRPPAPATSGPATRPGPPRRAATPRARRGAVRS
jgi:hypothetical protein